MHDIIIMEEHSISISHVSLKQKSNTSFYSCVATPKTVEDTQKQKLVASSTLDT